MIINENYKLESDSSNITLLERNVVSGKRGRPPLKEVGEVYWTPIAYFSNPQKALCYLVQKEINGTGMRDLKTIVDKISKLEKLINSLHGLPTLSDTPEKH